MRTSLLVALGAACLQAAAIRGTVVENQTGRPLARALVVLEPVSGVAQRTASTRTNQFGTFEFSGLPGGAYLMAVSRPGFAPVNYGQKRWRAPGIPIVVQAGESKVLNIPLPRFASIAGTVLDESDVGLPEHDVVAYRVARPLELVARARSDERGRYRIAGLEPGKYYIRTVARQYEDGGYLPTFYRDTLRADDATSIEVTLDQQTDDINIRPLAGNLLSLGPDLSSRAGLRDPGVRYGRGDDGLRRLREFLLQSHISRPVRTLCARSRRSADGCHSGSLSAVGGESRS